jgi:hypothetical protein
MACRWHPKYRVPAGEPKSSGWRAFVNSNQLDRAAYQAAYAILSGATNPPPPVDRIAEIIKNIFEPLCDADCAVPVGKFFNVAAEDAVQNSTRRQS